MPAYELNDFLNACGVPGRVFWWPCVLETARTDFGISTGQEVKRVLFIRDAKIIQHLATEPVRNQAGQVADSYRFILTGIFGYLAFFKIVTSVQAADGKWVIKSFHLEHMEKFKNVGQSTLFREAMREIGISKKDFPKHTERRN